MSSNSHEKLIIVDLGGVLVDLYSTNDLPSLSSHLRNTSLAEKMLDKKGLRFQVQDGSISFTKYARLVTSTGLFLSVRSFLEAEASLIGNPIIDRIVLLQTLRKQARIVALSNTHWFHWALIRKNQEICDVFDDLYLSYEIGALKPSENSYKKILEKEDFEPSKCMFIDDSLDNVRAAARIGINSLLVSLETDWKQDLRNWALN